MGTHANDAIRYIRLAVQINDWSLRRIAPNEMKTGFGWIQAKPACSMAPLAVTLDELAGSWTDARITATLEVYRDCEIFGAVPATQMAYGFHELIAHASRTRSLCAGTIIGSGTVSHSTFRQAGCAVSPSAARSK
jgi:fumarylacetoacetate (FAA) hydrolase